MITLNKRDRLISKLENEGILYRFNDFAIIANESNNEYIIYLLDGDGEVRNTIRNKYYSIYVNKYFVICLNIDNKTKIESLFIKGFYYDISYEISSDDYSESFGYVDTDGIQSLYKIYNIDFNNFFVSGGKFIFNIYSGYCTILSYTGRLLCIPNRIKEIGKRNLYKIHQLKDSRYEIILYSLSKTIGIRFSEEFSGTEILEIDN